MSRRPRTDTLLEPRVTALTDVLTAALAGEPEAVHQVRVASRRLREVLPAVVDADSRRGRHIVKAVRRVTRAFGPVRELDVALQLFDEGLAKQGLRPAAQVAVRRALHAARRVALRHARKKLTDARVGRVRERLDALTANPGPADMATAGRIHARAIAAARRLRKAVEHVTTVYSPTRLHEVRIGVKRLRYAIEAGGSARGVQRATTQVRQLRAVQDMLGRAHDLHVLGEFLQAVQRRVITRSRAVARDLEAFAQALEVECRALHAAFMSRRAALLTLASAIAAAPAAPAKAVA